eukprot:scaffold114676_cov57-Phaeocystis_antarctica.AAC.3
MHWGKGQAARRRRLCTEAEKNRSGQVRTRRLCNSDRAKVDHLRRNSHFSFLPRPRKTDRQKDRQTEKRTASPRTTIVVVWLLHRLGVAHVGLHLGDVLDAVGLDTARDVDAPGPHLLGVRVRVRVGVRVRVRVRVR